MNPSLSSRRAHRTRLSALRISSDTSTTLPEYDDSQRSTSHLPPVYPGTVPIINGDDDDEPIDTDTDTAVDVSLDVHDDNKSTLYPSSSPTRLTRRRTTPHFNRRRHPSYPPPDQYLDSLLERSVHALEMSNVLLLQSSFSTQTAALTSTPPDRSLEAPPGVSSRIRSNRDVQDHWLDDLDQIRRGVEGLFDDGDRHENYDDYRRPSTSISSSLPLSSSMPSSKLTTLNRRRPHRSSSSLDISNSDPDRPQLHLSHNQDRSHLISPPPRAITQYVASSTDAGLILLPSTIGLRAPPSTSHLPALGSGSGSSSSTSGTRPPPPPPLHANFLHSSTAPPAITGRAPEPSTPAYTMLSSLITRSASTGTSGSSTPAHSPRSSISSLTRWRSGSVGASTLTVNTINSHERDRNRTRPRTTPTSPEQIYALPSRVASSSSPQPVCNTSLPPIHRCPPIQELSPSPSPSQSSSSDDDCRAKLTVQSLRKILDEQPSNNAMTSSISRLPRRAPAFLPRSPPPAPASGTSTATASISRLFTKGTHSSSTRAPSPPRHSSLKIHQRNLSASALGSPTPSPAMFTKSLPEFLGFGGGSAPSSGKSTPKRIGFAELPEPHARLGGGGNGRGSDFAAGRGAGDGSRSLGSKLAGKTNRVGGRATRARKRKKSAESIGGGSSGSGEAESWWATWFMGAASAPVGGSFGPSGGAMMHVERGKTPPIGGGMEGWAV